MAKKTNSRHFDPDGQEYQGRLDKLFAADEGAPETDAEAVWIDRTQIEPNPYQPRKYFPRPTLVQLARSLRAVGQLQPVLVRPHPTKPNMYQLAAGERRWLASGPEFDDNGGPLPRLRATIRKMSDYEIALIAVEENDQREDVSPVARARGYQNLYTLRSQAKIKGQSATWDALAAEVGLTRRSVLRIVELLDLPEDIQMRIEEAGLSEKHGRALLELKSDEKLQRRLLREIEREGISGNEALRRAGVMLGKNAGASESDDEGDVSRETSEGSGTTGALPGTQGFGFAQGGSSGTSDRAGQNGITTNKNKSDVASGLILPAAKNLVDAKRIIGEIKMTHDYRKRVEASVAEVERVVQEIRKALR